MEGFDKITNGLKRELLFSNKQFKEWLNNLDVEVTKLEKIEKSKKVIATILKLAVVVSGIVIASGFFNDFDIVIRAIGAIVLLITAVERVFANVNVLLSTVAAKNAFSRVRREVVIKHTNELGPILGLKENNQEEAGRKIIELQSSLIKKLIIIDDKIKTSLEDKKYELLGRLTLEDKE